MNETERKLVTLLRRLHGDIITGTPVYSGSYVNEWGVERYQIIIIPPSSTTEKVYRAQVRIVHGGKIPNGTTIIFSESVETFWALRMDTVIAWISRLIDADVMLNNAEEYSK